MPSPPPPHRHAPGPRFLRRLVGLLVVCAVAAAGAAWTLSQRGSTPPAAAPFPNEPATDTHGIREIYPSLVGGVEWVADWGGQRDFDGVDPADPWFDADHGSARYTVSGGELRISGDTPRMHVHDPAERRQWGNVEITMYFKRVADTVVGFAGMVAVARTNHGDSGDLASNPCDTRGLGARVRYDGTVDFEKETSHPANEAGAERRIWPGGMPKNTWIGFKYVVYDLPGDRVRLELWLDRSDGRDGGAWRKVNQLVDGGRGFGSVPCARGVDPALPLLGDLTRQGSESGLPNLSVYFRSDGVRENGLVYKWGSIREIEPPS